jgi:hypothetical protein
MNLWGPDFEAKMIMIFFLHHHDVICTYVSRFPAVGYSGDFKKLEYSLRCEVIYYVDSGKPAVHIIHGFHDSVS